ncbi:UDP-N-acetylmuramate dehydrogenase [Bacteriovorax sp. Seq25_V]|uniref:UDP-N-acetylmuramate dehydrogenase n=1 Tax=Bacteriovorax sp. Seq25_V TaxID=1201288 RepID=UPI00038A2BF2|nr:UDP-N-acetylmuramate dehydrogenase [Bacteriovorax sp. Seq25_V]EQC43452.1 UDP-N-acetylmuramate dehydrogenase [Bacteriovorax sp. Seq25_V]
MKLDKLLANIANCEVELDKDLSKFSTMRLQASGDLISVTNEQALKEVLITLKNNQQKFIVLGMGANQLLKSKSELPYLMLKFEFDSAILNEPRESYLVPASLRLSSLTSHAAKFGLKGWEVFTGVPATIGGALFMNAGTGLGEICQVVKKVWYLTSEGKRVEHDVTPESFSYRKNNFLNAGDVIVAAELVHFGIDEEIKFLIKDYLQKRNASQPMSSFTCGCVFKNSSFEGVSCPAGKFIDIIGLKGLQVGGIRISHKHGNFMENFDNATYEDVKELISIVQHELKQQFGINFELEVKV